MHCWHRLGQCWRCSWCKVRASHRTVVTLLPELLFYFSFFKIVLSHVWRGNMWSLPMLSYLVLSKRSMPLAFSFVDTVDQMLCLNYYIWSDQLLSACSQGFRLGREGANQCLEHPRHWRYSSWETRADSYCHPGRQVACSTSVCRTRQSSSWYPGQWSSEASLHAML